MAQRPGFPQGLKVLLLDTCPSSSKVIEAQLLECGYSATTTTCLAEAVSKLASFNEYEIFLVELKALEEKGAVLSQLREAATTVPLVLFSDSAPVEHVVASFDLGAVEFLEKPLSLSKLQTLWQHTVRKKPSSPGSPGTPSPAHSYSPASHIIKMDADSDLDRSSAALLDTPAQSPNMAAAPAGGCQQSRRRKSEDCEISRDVRHKLQLQTGPEVAAASSCGNVAMPSLQMKVPDMMSQMMATLPQGMKDYMSMGFTGFKDFTTFLNTVAPYLPPPPPSWQAPPPLPPGMSWGLPAMPPPFMLPFLFNSMNSSMGAMAAPGFSYMYGGPGAGAVASSGIPAGMIPPFPTMPAGGMCAAQFMMAAGAMQPGMQCMPPFSGMPSVMMPATPSPSAPAAPAGVADVHAGIPVNTATVSDAMAAAGFAMPACVTSSACEEKLGAACKQQQFSGCAMADSPPLPVLSKACSMDAPNSSESDQTDMEDLGLPAVPSEAHLFAGDEMLFGDWLLEDDGMATAGDDMFNSLKKNSSLADLINDSLFTTLSAMG